MLVRRDVWLSKTSWRYSCAQRCGESEGLAHTRWSGHRKLHATGTVVSGDYLLISFRRPNVADGQPYSYLDCWACTHTRIFVYIYTCSRQFISVENWNWCHPLIGCRSCWQMHHASCQCHPYECFTANGCQAPFPLGVAVGACHLRQHQISPSFSSTHLSSELITDANSSHSEPFSAAKNLKETAHVCKHLGR